MRYLWYSMYGFVTALAIYALFFRQATTHQPRPEETPETVLSIVEMEQADVQIALILDTSSSMDGLVEQARTQVWEMVREMQLGPDGDEKVVAVALYQYGNNRLPRSEGYIQQLTPLTTDLDEVTVKLHSLKTSGGQEYAPLAVSRACQELEWNSDDGVERYIVIAGNEGFEQGKFRGVNAMKQAEQAQIVVMPIYCANRGASRTAVASWKTAARLAGTDFESIDPDQRVARIDTPYDDLILEKYRKLEEQRVYAPGSARSEFAGQAERCVKGGVAVDRALVQARQKKSKDLVSAYTNGKLESSAPLPSHLKNKSESERESYFKEKKSKQEKLKQELLELESQRSAHIKAQTREIPAYRSSLGGSFKAKASERRKGTLKNY